MLKSINLEKLSAAMHKAGLSQAGLAKALGVSREIVSKWLNGKKFPRPDKLLRLAIAVDLGLGDLVESAPDPAEPVIAFRKRGANKTTVAHIQHAKDMGRLLEPLVDYLPWDRLVQPPTLLNPTTDYAYVQDVAGKLRHELGVGPEDELGFHHLVNKFNDLQAVIIPVLWGKKDKHENALHIHLPASMTTWVYLNLDVEIHDFKFWMAHELAHVHAPQLRGNEAEDFADTLAGALIFPETVAGPAYKDISRSRTPQTRIGKIRRYAEKFSISMISVCYEINKYAKAYDLLEIKMDSALYGANTNLNKAYLTLSQTLFDDERPAAKDYIKTCEKEFETPFFNTLREFVREHGKSAGYVQSVLDTPLLDAKGIHAELA